MFSHYLLFYLIFINGSNLIFKQIWLLSFYGCRVIIIKPKGEITLIVHFMKLGGINSWLVFKNNFTAFTLPFKKTENSLRFRCSLSDSIKRPLFKVLTYLSLVLFSFIHFVALNSLKFYHGTNKRKNIGKVDDRHENDQPNHWIPNHFFLISLGGKSCEKYHVKAYKVDHKVIEY